MRDDRRAYPRFDVSLDLGCASAASETLRMHDLGEGGFLASGEIGAAVWDRIEASLRLGPGGAGVRLYGTITHAHPDGERQVIGVRIDRFGSPEEQRAYLDYARSLSPAS